MEIDIDTFNKELGKRFVQEANEILKNVSREVQDSWKEAVMTTTNMSRLAKFDVFLPEYVLTKIATNINCVLNVRRQQSTNSLELKGVIIQHVLAASYETTVNTMTSERNKEFFYQIGISGRRYNEVWSALCCTTDRRQRLEPCGSGWSNRPRRANALITELEDELAAINRLFLLVPGVTIFSLDDDHLRLRSRAVAQLTLMNQVNNPKKALGPVKNAICSALNPVFLASHYSRTGEKAIDVWERLIRLLQGVPTAGPAQAMTDAFFAADRGYKHKESIDYLNERVGATAIGTCKRSLDYPFVFGDGPVRKRHKGVAISEKGCRTIYSARRKPKTAAGRPIEAVVYRESYSGRVASVYHNNDRLFKASKFTLIPKTGYKAISDPHEREKFHRVFERPQKLCPAQAPGEGHEVFQSRLKVSQKLSGVRELTLLQSEDPGWFLARAFQFTSRTTSHFLTALAQNAEENLSALAEMVKGKETGYANTRLPILFEETNMRLKTRAQEVCDVLNISFSSSAVQSATEATRQFLLSSNSDVLDGKTRAELTTAMRRIGQALPTSLRKPQVIEKILQLQVSVQNGTVTLQSGDEESLTPEEGLQTACRRLLQTLYKKSLDSWVMKPLVSTVGMKEGTINEGQVLKSLPRFFDDNSVQVWKSESTEGNCNHYKVDYIRTVGLISSREERMISDSPDGLMAIVEEQSDPLVCALEIKSMTSLNTIQKARDVRDAFGKAVQVGEIGISEDSRRLFHKLVPSVAYRLQCMHHAMCLKLDTVCFIVSKGSNCGIGEIIYIAMIGFSEYFLDQYSYVLSGIRVAAFNWVGKEAKHIPIEYDDMLKSSHATDLHSYATYYSLSEAYKNMVTMQGPLPPARMIRPIVLVYWNHVKGGVDEFSRALTSLCYTNASENPIVSIIGRLLCAQVNNAAVVHSLSLAKKSGALTDCWKEVDFDKGYREIRHSVSRAASFADYARQLAKEFKASITDHQTKSGTQSSWNHRAIRAEESSNNEPVVEPMYHRYVVEKYNREDDAQRRLSRLELHKKVKGKKSYCSLLSYSHCMWKHGKKFRKKGGSKQRIWCSICRQAICLGCWDVWHEKRVLVRAQISMEELKKFEERIDKENV